MDESMLELVGKNLCCVFCSVQGTSKRSGRLLMASMRVCVRERRCYSTFVWTRSLTLIVETKTVDRIGYVSSTT